VTFASRGHPTTYRRVETGPDATTLGASALRERQRRIAEIDAAWGPYAHARAMVHRPGFVGWAGAQAPRIEAVVDRVPVALEMVSRAFDFVTVAFATPAVPLREHLEVTPEPSGLLGRFFCADDFRVGDEAFDRAYYIRTTAPSLARMLLSPEARAEILGLGCRHIAYDGGGAGELQPLVMLELSAPALEGETLDRLVRLAVLLARTQPAATSPYR